MLDVVGPPCGNASSGVRGPVYSLAIRANLAASGVLALAGHPILNSAGKYRSSMGILLLKMALR
jgi:hypothetical protein